MHAGLLELELLEHPMANDANDANDAGAIRTTTKRRNSRMDQAYTYSVNHARSPLEFAHVKFEYYDRLGAKQKAIYRKSDAIGSVAVPDPAALAALVGELDRSLSSGNRLATAKAASALVVALCQQIGVPTVRVTVRTVRPEISGGELHGLYTFAEKGSTPTIEVWMKTAAHERVVRFRTFLRTLLHEVVHHLDVTLLGLEDSFHTEGFFRRESSLVRQLLPKARPKPEKAKAGKPARPIQLSLFEAGKRR